ncbi:MAG: hypothetical protein IKV46_01285 [Bacteroidales bacterium]|nr:hypothetical protein [Bacteroidales bacterium]
MDNNSFASFFKNILKSNKFRAVCSCLFFSFILWLFISFSDYRQHDFEVPVQFENTTKPDEIYNVSDSIITVRVKATGFDFFFKSGFNSKKEVFHFDVNNISLNKSKGETKLSSNVLKPYITKFLGVEDLSVTLIPDTIILKWQKKYSKIVPVVNNTKFECKTSFRIEKEPQMFIDEVRIEGEKRVLDKIDTLYTKDIVVSNIDKNHISLIPIEIKQQYKGLYFQNTNIPIKIEVEQITENIVELPVNIVKEGIDENIKVFPSKVKVKYRLPIKDFKSINPESFFFYVLCGEDVVNKNKLRVKYSNIPDNVEIIDISPAKLNYLILNE